MKLKDIQHYFLLKEPMAEKSNEEIIKIIESDSTPNLNGIAFWQLSTYGIKQLPLSLKFYSPDFPKRIWTLLDLLVEVEDSEIDNLFGIRQTEVVYDPITKVSNPHYMTSVRLTKVQNIDTECTLITIVQKGDNLFSAILNESPSSRLEKGKVFGGHMVPEVIAIARALKTGNCSILSPEDIVYGDKIPITYLRTIEGVVASNVA
ncbi:MAG TPA: hypothetical protein VGE63_01340 [Candidatus Paceibacterota bacterium]